MRFERQDVMNASTRFEMRYARERACIGYLAEGIVIVAVLVALTAGLCPAAAWAGSPEIAAGELQEQASASKSRKPVHIQASKATYVKSENRQSASGVAYSAAKAGGRMFKVSGGKLTMSEGGKTRTLAKGAYSSFVTNGRYVFYAKVGKQVGEAPFYAYRQTVFRLDVDKGAKKRVGEGVNWVPFACNDKYPLSGWITDFQGLQAKYLNVG